MRLAIIAIIALLAGQRHSRRNPAHDTTVTDALFSAIRMSDMRCSEDCTRAEGRT